MLLVGAMADVARIRRSEDTVMKLLKTAILALSLTVTATVGRAADYEIFAEFATVETGVNQLDYPIVR
jgi:hypothetical protein